MDPDQPAHAGPSANGTLVNKTEPKNELQARAPSAATAAAAVAALAIKPNPEAQQEIPEAEAGEEEGGQPIETSYLGRLVTQDSTRDVAHVLEAGVSVGLRLLERLTDTLNSCPCPDAEAWITNIREIQERAKPIRTVVGVVGNTGSGKSSVINALLDEERLLPTNCLRACTASPTEISYNYSEDPSELYRAEIEFISAQDWTRELEVLFSDVLDGTGQISRDCSNSDSDAGVSYAKIKAVYPTKTRDMLAQSSPARLADEPAVRGVLGSVKIIKDGFARDLYRRMQHFVDSKEKTTSANKKKREEPMEYWPLIKVVRIYTKADALSTGAVIVDLPGVQDSNAARAAVAENYMKSCDSLWIVAPITRAVDDKTAKSLLGDSFKRQLKYDGTFSAVTFICSKTDDISITEAADSLGIEEETSESWERADELRKAKLSHREKLTRLKEEKDALRDELDEYEVKYDIWEDLQGQISDGKTVYAPSENPKKRKRPQKPTKSRKTRVPFDMDDDDDDDDDDDSDFSSISDASDKENSQPEAGQNALTEEKIEEMLVSIKDQRKQIRGDIRSLDIQISATRREMLNDESESDQILSELKAICIKGRNDYSRGAIKQDFAMGIKELDQENAVEQDEASFDPDQDIRDYDEVARRLPVFCVCSRAYQKLNGRFLKDDFKSDGFLSLDDTEVPQLQEHAKKLTEAGRASHCRRLLNDLTQIVNSMKLWSANDGTLSHLTDGEKQREELHLRNLLDGLQKGFEASVKAAIGLMEQSLDEHIYQTFHSLIPSAVDAAFGTAVGWGASRTEGGLYWATYKATVRRKGVYTGASGSRDFNQELFDPISRGLANEWERAFQRRLPPVLAQLSTETKAKLLQFKEAAEGRAKKRLTNPAGLLTLSNQILAHMRTLEELPAILRTAITDFQREANRQFTPAICEAMASVYEVCTNESGPGQYSRMKEAMEHHVNDTRDTMFHQAENVLKGQLEAMCRAIKKSMTESTEGIYDAVFRDYMSVLVGTTVERRARVSQEELRMRKRVSKLLLRGDLLFAPILGEPEVGGLDMDRDSLTPQAQEENEMMGGVANMPASDSAIKLEVEHGNLPGDARPVMLEIGTQTLGVGVSFTDKAEANNGADDLVQRSTGEQSMNENNDPPNYDTESEASFPDIMDILEEHELE